LRHLHLSASQYIRNSPKFSIFILYHFHLTKKKALPQYSGKAEIKSFYYF